MPRDVAISPPIRGAARTLDWTYPSPQIQAAGTVAVGIQWINRQGLAILDTGTVTGFGIPPAGSGWTLYKGRMAHRQTGSGTSGGFYRTGGDFAIYFPTLAEQAKFNDDFRCWRIVAIMAFDLGLGSGDTGLEISPSGFNYDIVVGTPPGFRIAPFSPTEIGLQVRQNGGGAFTVNQVVASGLDITEWNAYEIRFIGATRDADASMQAFVNGRRVASFSWGAGTLLPGFANGTGLGYMIGVGNRGATGTYIAQCGLQVSAAASAQGLV